MSTLVEIIRLSAWLQKCLDVKQRFKKHRLPVMPSFRRLVTPAAVHEPSYLLFQLSRDVQSVSILMAFGKCALHVDVMRQEKARPWRGHACYYKREVTVTLT